MDELLKLANKYDVPNFLEHISRIEEHDLNRLLELFFSLGNTHIYQHDKNKREQRSVFFTAILNFCKERSFRAVFEEVINKLKVIYCAEELFDEIKGSLVKSELSKLPSEQQCWAQIGRVENELIKIESLLKEKFENRETKDKIFSVSERVKIELNGTEADPDFVIEQIVSSLSLSLTLLGHQNKWFDKSGKLVLPSPTEGKVEDKLEAAEIANLALSWQKLESTSARCVLFDGEVFIRDASRLEPKEKELGLTKTYHFHPNFSEFEKFDFISQRRVIDKHNQNFFETVLESSTKGLVVNDINEISSIDELSFLSENEINTLTSLSGLFCENIIENKTEYHGLTIREWVRAYSCLIYLVKNGDSSENSSVYQTSTLKDLFISGGLTEDKAEIFINLATFGISSRDFYDKPLLKLDNGSYYIFHPLFKGFSVFFTVLSVFSELEIIIKNKGKNFETLILDKLHNRGIQAGELKFKRDRSEYEYDALFILDNKLFVVECKNRSLSGWNPVRGARFEKFIDKTVDQVNRLVAGLKLHPEVFEEHFGRDINEFEIIPIIMNALPFAYPGKYKGVYLSDSSSFGQFLSSKTINFREYEGKNNKVVREQELYNLWQGEHPNSHDLIAHLDNPIHLEVYRNNMEVQHPWLKASDNVWFTFGELKADLQKGLEIKFSKKLEVESN